MLGQLQCRAFYEAAEASAMVQQHMATWQRDVCDQQHLVFIASE
jgi:hypothetical protein